MGAMAAASKLRRASMPRIVQDLASLKETAGAFSPCEPHSLDFENDAALLLERLYELAVAKHVPLVIRNIPKIVNQEVQASLEVLGERILPFIDHLVSLISAS